MEPVATAPGGARGRVVMLVDNGVHGDSRVQKAARSAAMAGWDVILLGRSLNEQPQSWQIGQASVRLVPMPSPLGKRPHEFRRSWLRGPLGYPPSGIAAHRAQRVRAWRADLLVRQAALTVAPELEQTRTPLWLRRASLFVQTLSAQVLGKWVSFRYRQLTRAQRARRRLDGPWDRAYTYFWRKAMGDRSWRRLEPRLWDFELAFGKEIDALAPDLIHANDFYMLGVGARATVRARAEGRSVKLVWDAHELVSGLKSRTDNVRWLPAHIAHEREYAPLADAAITVSDDLARTLQANHGLAETPAVILNAPSMERHLGAEPAPDIRELCGIGPDVPLVVYSGAAAPQRGLGIMVDALPRLEGVHVAFVVAQPPSKYVRGLQERAAELGVAERLHLLPYVPHDQVVAFLSGADIGVIPIHHYPNHEIALITKFFEYAHARLPMVVSDVRTMAETTIATGLGEVFRAEDMDYYVRAIGAVLADPKRYRSAYDRPGLLENWTWEAQAEILDQVYSRLVASPVRDVIAERVAA